VINDMTKNGPNRRILLAAVFSLLVNGILIALSVSFKPLQYSSSRIVGIASDIAKPPMALAEWLVPPGADGGHFIEWALTAILLSIVFYASLTWFVLSMPDWWRNR